MATDIASLFGLTPEGLSQQRYQQDLKQGYELAQLSRGDAARATLQSGVGQLGRGIAGLMGVEDPQMKLISARQQIIGQLDQTDPNSIVVAIKQLQSIGDQQGAMALMDYARKAQESATKTALQQAQTLKALQPPKGTSEERSIESLRIVENKLRAGETPTLSELSNANIAGQIMAKPRSYTDPTSGQLTTVQGTDPSKAFPLAYKEMARLTPESVSTAPKVDVQQVTAGNLPASSQQEIATIEASLKKLENTSPQLDAFSNLLKSGDVKFNAAANAFDFLGATVPPIFGGKEVGNQVKKDEFTRAFKERINTVLNNAKGVQAKDDAKRAEEQIASASTFLSTERMQGAINYLKNAEAGYKEELEARRGSLQRQGQPEEKATPSTKFVEQKQITKSTAKASEMTRDQKIEAVIQFNAGKGVTVTRSQAEQALRAAGKL